MASRRRIITQASVFLLLGAIVNVGVAWGCAMRARQRLATGSSESVVLPESGQQHDENDPTNLHLYISVYEGCGVVQYRLDQYRVDQGLGGDLPLQTGSALIQKECGWPFLAVTGRCRQEEYLDWALKIPHDWQRPIDLFQQYGDAFVPLLPIWPGFAINTLLYGAILWGLFAAPSALRRRRRIKRGLCPKCAYPIGESDVCTECGTPRPILTRTVGTTP